MTRYKEIVAVIGPNGSGKTSAVFATGVSNALPFINPDDIAKHDYGHIRDEDKRNQLAWLKCNALRELLIADGESFGFETVGSHPSKVELLKNARRLGYLVTVLFVGTETPDINIRRIAQRVALGGHSVPDEKVRARYQRTMRLLPEYFDVADVATVWDNSIDDDAGSKSGAAIRELVRKDSDGIILTTPDAQKVHWIQKCFPSFAT